MDTKREQLEAIATATANRYANYSGSNEAIEERLAQAMERADRELREYLEVK